LGGGADFPPLFSGNQRCHSLSNASNLLTPTLIRLLSDYQWIIEIEASVLDRIAHTPVLVNAVKQTRALRIRVYHLAMRLFCEIKSKGRNQQANSRI
jgi:hypothetical protein